MFNQTSKVIFKNSKQKEEKEKKKKEEKVLSSIVTIRKLTRNNKWDLSHYLSIQIPNQMVKYKIRKLQIIKKQMGKFFCNSNIPV